MINLDDLRNHTEVGTGFTKDAMLNRAAIENQNREKLRSEYYDGFTNGEIKLFVQWFGSVQDLSHPDFLKNEDYILAAKIYEHIGLRVPDSISAHFHQDNKTYHYTNGSRATLVGGDGRPLEVLHNHVLQSLRSAVVFSSIDWSSTRHLAWIYAIVVGWDDDALNEVANQFNWDEETLARLSQLHAEFDLLGVGFVDEVRCLKTDDGDKIIIHTDRVLTADQKRRVVDQLKLHFKNNECLVLDGGLRFGIVKT